MASGELFGFAHVNDDRLFTVDELHRPVGVSEPAPALRSDGHSSMLPDARATTSKYQLSMMNFTKIPLGWRTEQF